MPPERHDDVGHRPPPSGPGPAADGTAPTGSRLRAAAARLIRIPLYHKILLANAAAVALAAGLATWFTATHGLGRSDGLGPLGAAVLIAAAGGMASAAVHVFLLRRALAPLKELGRVASRIREEGPDVDIRARIPRTADRNLADLIRVFNGMLDTMSRYRSQLRRLAGRTLEATEEERKLVARRLQEDTAQRLASLMVRLQVLRRASDPGRRDAVLEELRQEIALALESVRHTARGLHPPELGDIGLERALRAFARTLANGRVPDTPRVDFSLQPLDAELDEGGRLALYRILQEALRNAYAHADATEIRVEIRRDGDRLRATVRDDGSGLPDAGGGGGEESLGILTMRERAIHVGGTLEIASRAGEGTTVTVDLPLPERYPPDPHA